jgi:phosphopantetheinyl transferase
VVVRHASSDAATLPRLSAGDRARLFDLAGAAERARFLAGRAALLRAAAQLAEAGITVDAACPDCGAAHGRPRALGAARPLFLALAHGGGAAYAVAARAPVGVDAEPLFTPAERRAAVDELAPGRGDALRRWTAIEAVLKADGRGLRVPPDAVRVGRLRAELDGRRYRLRSLRSDGCLVTIARGQRESDGSAV